MTKVYEFPTKKELPELVKKGLCDIATVYVDLLEYVLTNVASDDPSLEELDELKYLVVHELEQAIELAIYNSVFK